MPPKVVAKAKAPAPKDLVKTGPREVFTDATKKTKPKRQEKDSTARALVLRNGKHGAWGTGEIVAMARMTGREKMDLLAEDLLEKSKKAIMTPFRLEDCLKIAESQCDAYVDDIANLKDADLFYQIIEAELSARNAPTRDDVRKQPTYVAKVVSTRLHNSYMLASAWKIVSKTLDDFAIDGLTDQNVKSKLKSDVDFRDRYLKLWDMVNTLVDLSQDNFSVLATTSPHYARFFKLKPTESTDPSEPEFIFDWTDLRKVADSFIDSIIIELCFPRGMYPKAVLYQLLRDAVAEAPKDAKRFPQALWDAVGDLSVSVKLQELLSAPLFGTEGNAWKQLPREMPEEYENWVDAQLFSRAAADLSSNLKDLFYPLEKTKKKSVLHTMWESIDANYVKISGQGIDVLWGLSDNLNYAPQWTAEFKFNKGVAESDDEGPPGLARSSKRKIGGKPERKRITNGRVEGTDSDMPDLQSISNSSNEEDDDEPSSDSEGDDDDSDDDSDESGYNTEEEDEIRDLLREAMDAAHEADYFSSSDVPKEIDPFAQEDRKGNPFLKLLGSLRGRMFSSNPKLKSTTREIPRSGARGAFRATPSGAPKTVPTTIPPKTTSTSAPRKTSATSPAQASKKATVEDATDDEDGVSLSPKKKKKKKKTKKKKAPGDIPDSPSVGSLADTMASSTLGSMSAPSVSSPKKTPVAAQSTSPKPSPAKVPSFSSSTTTLPIGETSVQSGRSYLQSQNIKVEKKTKSRPDHASLFSSPEEDMKKGFFSKFSLGKDKDDNMTKAKQTWFTKLGKKTNKLMHQLLRTSGEARGSMKWDDFVKLMKEMGFTYDPSTAGSSVRFDPPNKGDSPITFHKPHPDPTLAPHLLREFAKKLERRYGWTEEDLAKLG